MASDEEFPATASHHDAHPAFGRFGDNLQFRAADNVLTPDFRVPAVRHLEHIVESPEDGQTRIGGVLAEHTKHLAVERIFGHAIVVVESRLCRPTDVKRTGDVGFHPLENLGHLIPIRHLFVSELFDGGAGDDHAVELLFLEDVEILVEHHHVLDGRILGGVALEFHKTYLQLQGRIGEQPHQVGLRGNLERHEVEDDDAQRTDVLRVGARVVHHEDILLLEQFNGR